MHWIPPYKLSKYIDSIIFPLAGKTSSHVLNSKHFAETMRDVYMGSDEPLFITVPIEEAVGVIRDKLREDGDLVERTPLSLERHLREIPY